MLVPQVVGFRLTGALREGATATDLVLTVTEILRRTGVVGKFVEYFGPGVGSLALADRATLGNMSPEYGATCGFFPVDEVTVGYLRLTGRSPERIALVEAYCKENQLWHEPDEHPEYSQVVELDLDDVEPSLAGPRRPQDRVPLASAKEAFIESLGTFGVELHERDVRQGGRRLVPGERPADRRRGGDGAEPVPDAHRDAREEAGRGRGRGLRARARLRRDRRDHVLHEHVQPVGDDRRRPARPEGGRARARAAAVGQVLPRPWLEGRERVLPRVRPRPVPRRARLQHGRLRLHDVHRELRPAARADQRRRRGRRPRRLRRPLRQPQLRGAHPRRGEGELPRVAAARRRVRARRADGRRPRERAARPGLRRRGRLPARPLAEPGRDRPA